MSTRSTSPQGDITAMVSTHGHSDSPSRLRHAAGFPQDDDNPAGLPEILVDGAESSESPAPYIPFRESPPRRAPVGFAARSRAPPHAVPLSSASGFDLAYASSASGSLSTIRAVSVETPSMQAPPRGVHDATPPGSESRGGVMSLPPLTPVSVVPGGSMLGGVSGASGYDAGAVALSQYYQLLTVAIQSTGSIPEQLYALAPPGVHSSSLFPTRRDAEPSREVDPSTQPRSSTPVGIPPVIHARRPSHSSTIYRSAPEPEITIPPADPTLPTVDLRERVLPPLRSRARLETPANADRDVFLTSIDFSIEDCLLDLDNSPPSPYNPLTFVHNSRSKGHQITTTSIPLLERRGQWTEWNDAVLGTLGSYNLCGWVLEPGDVARQCRTWEQPVHRPRLNRKAAADDVKILHRFDQLDSAALHVVTSRVSSDVKRQVLWTLNSTGTTKALQARDWYQCIRLLFGRQDYDSGRLLWQRAQALQCGMNVTSYLDNYRRLIQEIEESSYFVNYPDLIAVFLSRLPPHLRHLSESFSRDFNAELVPATLKFDDVLAWIEKARRINHGHMAVSLAQGSAQNAPRVPNHRRIEAPVPASRSTTLPRGPVNNGPAIAATAAPPGGVPGGRYAGTVCYGCQKVGHTQANCPEAGGGRHSSKVGSTMAPAGYLSAGAVDVGGDELVAAEAVLADDDLVEDVPPEEMFAGLAAARSAVELDDECATYANAIFYSSYDGCAMAAVSSSLALSAVSSPPLPEPPPVSPPSALASRVAVVDSGCSQHIISDRRWFHSFKATNLAIGTANSRPLLVYGCGTVKVPVRFTDGSSAVLVLVDCLYAPDCPLNLLSVGRLTDVLNLRVLFGSGRTVVWEHTPGSRPCRFLALPRRNYLTVMHCDFVPPPVSLAATSVSLLSGSSPLVFSPPTQDFALWHRRLGHPGWELTRSVLRGSGVDGVEYVGDLSLPLKCVPCIMGKEAQKPFDHAKNRATRAGELVHIDICGPFRVEAHHSRARYFFVILDDATNFCWVALLRTRDDACDMFMLVDARLKNVTGRPIGSVRVDGAPELCAGRLGDHFIAEGIARQLTVRYAHQQNGKAERKVRHIQDLASCLMVDSGLPRSFWGWAVLTVCFTTNRLPTSTLPQGRTPFEALLDLRPNISYFRVFGCRCWYLIPPELRRKGDGRRLEAIFLGYESDRKGWRVLGVDGVLTFSHDVVFDEGTMGRLRGPRSKADTHVTAGGVASLWEIEGGARIPPLTVEDDVASQPTGGTSSVSTLPVDGGTVPIGGEGVEEGSQAVPGTALRRSKRLLEASKSLPSRSAFAVTVEDVGDEDGACTMPIDLDEETVLMAISSCEDEIQILQAFAKAEDSCLDLDNDFMAYMATVGCHRMFDDGHISFLSSRGLFRDLDDNTIPSAYMAYNPSKAPETLREAMSRPDWPRWREAMVREYRSLEKRGAFQKVERVAGMSVISVRWVFAHKMNPDGTIRWGEEKARLVARGFTQRPGDYDETYAPVAKLSTIRIVLALTATWDHELFSFDITTAFLHSKLKEQVYIAQIPGFPEASSSIVLRLLVALYGLKQAAFAWYCHFMQVLVSIGMRRCDVDHAFFIGVWHSPPDPSITMPSDGQPLRLLVPIHVDDGLGSTNSALLYKWFIRRLDEEGISVKDLGPASMFLAMRIHRDRTARRLWISQAPFIRDLLETWKMWPCRGAKVPLETLPDEMPDPDGDDWFPHSDLMKAYQSLTGSIQFLAGSRPDLAFAAMQLGRYASRPERRHMAAAKHVLRYIYQTRDHALLFDASFSIDKDVDPFIRSCAGFTDADWASDKETRVSISGYVFYYFGSAISWCSKRQRVIALSSTEAEYYAVVLGVCEALSLRALLLFCGFPCPAPFPMLMDNKSAMAQVSSPAVTARSKHIHIRELFIKQYYSDGTFQANWVRSPMNVADVFTKVLDRVLFSRFRDALGVVTLPSPI